MAKLPEISGQRFKQGLAVALACGAVAVGEAAIPGNQVDSVASGIGDVAGSVVGDTGDEIAPEVAIVLAVQQARDNPPPTYTEQIERQYFSHFEEEVPRLDRGSGLLGLGRRAVSAVFGAPKLAVTLGSNCLANTRQGKLFMAARRGEESSDKYGLKFNKEAGLMHVSKAGNAPRITFRYPDASPANSKTKRYLKRHHCPAKPAYPHVPRNVQVTRSYNPPSSEGIKRISFDEQPEQQGIDLRIKVGSR